MKFYMLVSKHGPIKSLTKSPAGVKIFSYQLFDTREEAEANNYKHGIAHGHKQGSFQVCEVEVTGDFREERALPRTELREDEITWHENPLTTFQ